jgi:phage portal protein BeeE
MKGDEDSNDHEVVTDHPLYALLLRREPNSEMTAATFKETLQCNLGLWGNAYARIGRTTAGKINADLSDRAGQGAPGTVRRRIAIYRHRQRRKLRARGDDPHPGAQLQWNQWPVSGRADA